MIKVLVIEYRLDTESLVMVTKPTELTIDPKTWVDKFKLPEQIK